MVNLQIHRRYSLQQTFSIIYIQYILLYHVVTLQHCMMWYGMVLYGMYGTVWYVILFYSVILYSTT